MKKFNISKKIQREIKKDQRMIRGINQQIARKFIKSFFKN